MSAEWKVLIAAAALGLVGRLLKGDVPWFFTASGRWKPLVLTALAAVGVGLEHFINGTAWKQAALLGLMSLALPIAGHQIGIESIRGGKELPMLLAKKEGES
jgi:hypothetical protein